MRTEAVKAERKGPQYVESVSRGAQQPEGGEAEIMRKQKQ